VKKLAIVVKDGKSFKICTGPTHHEPTLLPVEEFHVRRSKGREGELISRCKTCVNFRKLKNPGTNHGWIPIDKQIFEHVQEMVNRVGIVHASRLSEINENTLRSILNEETERIQKRTYARILSTIRLQRENGMLYHKKDIRAGIERKQKNGVKLRKVYRPSDQSGPVYPEIEQEQRNKEAQWKRASRARQKAREDQLERLSGY